MILETRGEVAEHLNRYKQTHLISDFEKMFFEVMEFMLRDSDRNGCGTASAQYGIEPNTKARR